jgi:DNA helicase INO80
VGNKQFTEATKPSEIVSLLLNDEELANLGNAPSAVDASVSVAQPSTKQIGKQPEGSNVRDLWNEEGDDFFGQPNIAAQGNAGMDADDDMTPPPLPEALHLTKRKGKTGAKRGRKKKVSGI